jgi:DNA-binding GntR family transcriptional regulator
MGAENALTTVIERPPGVSRGQLVYDSIRSQIFSCVLRPSERLKTTDIADQHYVSISVVREALTRLAEQGLVSFGAQQGVCVISLRKGELLDLTAVRSEIETLALRSEDVLPDDRMCARVRVGS